MADDFVCVHVPPPRFVHLLGGIEEPIGRYPTEQLSCPHGAAGWHPVAAKWDTLHSKATGHRSSMGDYFVWWFARWLTPGVSGRSPQGGTIPTGRAVAPAHRAQ